MMKLDRFTRGSRTEGGTHRRYQYARCGNCLVTGEVRDTGDGWHPPEVVAKKLEQRGWFIGKVASKDRCPACDLRKAKTTKGEDEMPIDRAVAATPKQAPVGSQATVALVAPTPPRDPTPAQRRSVRETLETRYDEDKGRYYEDYSDAKVAELLQMPRAWVTQIREAGGYGPDVNEASAQKDRALVELEQRAKDLEDKCMILAQQCETLRRDVAKARAA